MERIKISILSLFHWCLWATYVGTKHVRINRLIVPTWEMAPNMYNKRQVVLG